MKTATFPVCPLGKYGHTYLLDKPTYWLYKAVGITTIGSSLILTSLGIIISPHYSLPWSSDSLVNFGILVALLGTWLVLGIASRGRKVDENQIDLEYDKLTQRSSLFVRFLQVCKWFLISMAIIFLLLSVLSIVAALYLQRPVSATLLVFVIPSIFVLLSCFPKLWPRSKKKSSSQEVM